MFSIKKKFKKKKALQVVTWDDSDEEDQGEDEQEEVADMCFMAMNDEVSSSKPDGSSYEKLSHAYEEIL